MIKVRSVLGKHILFPFLLPVFFVLHTARYLWGGVPAGGAAAVLLLYLFISAVIYAIARICSRHGAGAGVAALLTMTLFIYWGELTRHINKFLHTQNYTHLPLILLAWMGLATWLAWLLNRQAPRKRSGVVFYLNALFLLYILVEVAMMGYTALQERSRVAMIAQTSLKEDRHIGAGRGPNVYLLLMDEYASGPSLKEEWGFDNSGMDSLLRRRGFAVNAASRSNYQMTFFSMASMLNMDYLQPAFERKYIDMPDYVECQRRISQARAISLFKQAGYTFHNLSIFEIDGQPKPDLHDLLVNGQDLLTVNNGYHLLRRDYIPYLQNRQAIRKDASFHDPSFYYIDTYNNRRVQEVLKIAGQPADRPRFVYAHFLMPHFPFYYDSAGRYLPVSIAKTTIEHKAPRLYWYNVLQANRQIIRMTDAILSRERGNAVILVIGDHGFRSQQQTKHRDELFRNFNAVYFPDKDYRSVPAGITNVNLFRTVFNKLFNTAYPLLPDRCIELEGASR